MNNFILSYCLSETILKMHESSNIYHQNTIIMDIDKLNKIYNAVEVTCNDEKPITFIIRILNYKSYSDDTLQRKS